MDILSIGGDPKKDGGALVRIDPESLISQFKKVPMFVKVCFAVVVMIGLLYYLVFRPHLYDSDSDKLGALVYRTEKLHNQMENIQGFLNSYNKVLTYLDLRIRLQELSAEFLQDQNEIILRYLEQSSDKEDMPYLLALRDAIERSHRNEERIKSINKSLLTQDSVDVAKTLEAIRIELMQLRSKERIEETIK